MRRPQIIALGLGVALFVYLLYRTGIETILADLKSIGWGLAVVILLERLLDGANTVGWWLTFPPSQRGVGLSTLYWIRLAGTALNQALPAATIGGEPVKVMLLRPYLPTSDATATVITAKLTYSLAQALLILAGFLFAFDRLKLPGAVAAALVVALMLTLLGLMLFFRMQRRGLFAASATLLERLRLPIRRVEALRRATALLDERIRDFHRLRRADLALSVLVHLGGFGFGILEVYLLLRWLGLPADAVTCLAVESFSVLIQFALFLVPGSIGVQEGGKILIFTALGLPAAAGLSVGIAFRLNHIAEVALGLGVLAALQGRQGRRSESQAPAVSAS